MSCVYLTQVLPMVSLFFELSQSKWFPEIRQNIWIESERTAYSGKPFITCHGKYEKCGAWSAIDDWKKSPQEKQTKPPYSSLYTAFRLWTEPKNQNSKNKCIIFEISEKEGIDLLLTYDLTIDWSHYDCFLGHYLIHSFILLYLILLLICMAP